MTATSPDTDPLLAEVGANGVAEFDFGRLDISQATAVFKLPWVSPEAGVLVRPVMENSQYAASMLRLSGDRQRSVAQSGRINLDDNKKDRDDDKGIYPKYIIVKLVGITDKAGNAVASTVDNIAAFVQALPNWIFDKIRLFCLDPTNFVNGPDELEPDVVGHSKNS